MVNNKAVSVGHTRIGKKGHDKAHHCEASSDNDTIMLIGEGGKFNSATLDSVDPLHTNIHAAWFHNRARCIGIFDSSIHNRLAIRNLSAILC